MKKISTVERLDKFLANNAGFARSNIKKLLKLAEVTVNDERVTKLGVRIDPFHDVIKINGEKIEKKRFMYYALNKPMGYISTTVDSLGRESVVDLIDTDEKIYPIGRLDKDTHGLLLLTNDGELTHKLIHPKFHVQKVYKLTVAERPTKEQLHALRTGVLLRDGITLPARVEIEEATEKNFLQMTIREGKNRQIRRMCEAVGLTLLDLQRIQFGPVLLGEIKPGEYRELSVEEVRTLQDAPEIKT